MKEEKAILAVSFGTSHEDTRKKTIDKIEEEIAKSFPECRLYRAWTSKVIIRILKNREGIEIDGVEEAMQRMKADKIRKVIIQPTHIINGIEYELMKEEAKKHMHEFESICFGAPLLNADEDYEAVVEIFAKLKKEWEKAPDEGRKEGKKKRAYLLMGHGSSHYANAAYAALDYRFKDKGLEDFFVGTVEAYPGIENIIKKLKASGYERALLFPLMIVAGDHAKEDMAGEDPSSWKSILQENRIEAEAILMGLGEIEEIRTLLLSHIRKAGQGLI
ncbi:MAG: sirohydrochlorin cobaltochelatase [Johnsonella sp.]|nr:sirohydrochlorin cobaltochelatase [Johnsonella sp.]